MLDFRTPDFPSFAKETVEDDVFSSVRASNSRCEDNSRDLLADCEALYKRVCRLDVSFELSHTRKLVEIKVSFQRACHPDLTPFAKHDMLAAFNSKLKSFIHDLNSCPLVPPSEQNCSGARPNVESGASRPDIFVSGRLSRDM